MEVEAPEEEAHMVPALMAAAHTAAAVIPVVPAVLVLVLAPAPALRPDTGRAVS